MTREAIFHVQLGVVSPRGGAKKKRNQDYTALHKAAAYHGSCRIQAPGSRRAFDFTKHAADYEEGYTMLPANAPAEFGGDKQKLLDAMQGAETRWDGIPARWVEITIPWDVPDGRRMDFMRQICQPWADEGRAVIIDIHNPVCADQSGRKQPHGHVLVSSRSLGPDGFSATKLDEKPWRTRRGRDMRGAIADRMNAAMVSYGLDVRVDHRSRKERGEDTPAERNVSKKSWEAYKRDPSSPAAMPAAETVLARDVRQRYREARRDLQIADAEVAAITAEAQKRYAVVRPPKGRTGTLHDGLRPPVGGLVRDVRREANCFVIGLADGNIIDDRGGYVGLKTHDNTPMSDGALSLLADQAERHGWKNVELVGNPDVRERLAAALAVRGITVSNFGKPSNVALTEARRFLPRPGLRSGAPAGSHSLQPTSLAGGAPRRGGTAERPAAPTLEPADRQPQYRLEYRPAWAKGPNAEKRKN